jgi:formamidopyrimidine-DNA glycosylase
LPELPEVETVRLGLAASVVGSTIELAEVHHQRATRRQPGGESELLAGVAGRSVSAAKRRGKYLWLEFADQDDGLAVHLGMSGQLRVVEAAEPDPHARVDFELADGRVLRFRDQRTFGWVLFDERVVVDGVELPRCAAHIAPDPFEVNFEPDAVAKRMARSRAGVKRLLLDQRIVSGIGNIYADEALWRAKVNYEISGIDLGETGANELLQAATEVMTEALAAGGTSFDALYVDVSGDRGWFERSLDAYGREGEPCSRCGTGIVRERFANRSSYLCPECQRAPGAS